MKRNGGSGGGQRLTVLTLPEGYSTRLAELCPTCWKEPQPGCRVVVGKGRSHVCLACAESIARLMHGERQRRCSRRGCSRTFLTRGRGRYCSNACRQKAYRDRVGT